MSFLTIFFWISFSVLFFCYIGYGIILLLLNKLRHLFTSPEKNTEPAEWPPVTLIVAAYNEEKVLEQKIGNTLAIDYPAGKLKIIFITDGSTDSSAAIINRYPSLTLLNGP